MYLLYKSYALASLIIAFSNMQALEYRDPEYQYDWSCILSIVIVLLLGSTQCFIRTMPESQPAFHARIYVLLVSDDLYFLICFGTDVKFSFLIGRFLKWVSLFCNFGTMVSDTKLFCFHKSWKMFQSYLWNQIITILGYAIHCLCTYVYCQYILQNSNRIYPFSVNHQE